MDPISEIICRLSAFDEELLLLINGLHTPILDSFMWFVSDKWVWIPFYVLLACFVVRHYSWHHGFLCLLMIAATIAATDQTCASFLRPLLARLRPSNPDNPISSLIHIVNNYHGGRFGFPSCHAANSFALAAFLSLCFRNKYITISMAIWTTLLVYSRLYLGVHYPSDILGGMAVGGFYALTFYGVFRMLTSPMSKNAVRHAMLWSRISRIRLIRESK